MLSETIDADRLVIANDDRDSAESLSKDLAFALDRKNRDKQVAALSLSLSLSLSLAKLFVKGTLNGCDNCLPSPSHMRIDNRSNASERKKLAAGRERERERERASR